MLLGREKELNYLQTCYEKDEKQLVILYGQKQVGKTSLLHALLKDKPGCYYLARQISTLAQIQGIYEMLQQSPMADGQNMYSYSAVFAEISKEYKERSIIAIDEFHHIVKQDETFMDAVVDSLNENSEKMMIVLCSSSVSFVENALIAKIGNTASKITAFFKMKELSFKIMTEYFTHFNKRQCVEAYSILGGIPGYWECFDDTKSIRENICEAILRHDSALWEIGTHLASEELREPAIYYTILEAMAKGKRKLNDLHEYTGFSRAKISVYLKNLMELEIADKVASFDTAGRNNAQKGIYKIENNFAHFWFSYIFPYLGSFFEMSTEEFYDTYIEMHLKQYCNEYYSQICFEYLEDKNRKNKLPIKYIKSGVWLGKTGRIDIVTKDSTNHILTGFCNFCKPIMTYEELEQAYLCLEQAKLKPDYIYLFSENKFDERIVLEAMIKKNIQLVSLREMEWEMD